MADSSFTIFDLELAADWSSGILLYAASQDWGGGEVREAIRSAFSDGGVVTEDDISEAISTELGAVTYHYRQGDLEMSEQGYEQALVDISNKDRELVRQELLEASGEIGMTDGIAAGELLCALLGFQTASFESFLKMSIPTLSTNFQRIAASSDEAGLKSLVPEALSLVRSVSAGSPGEIFGVTDGPELASLMKSIDDLKHNLERAQKDLP
ncbi:MAG: hypothetical protein K0U93_23760 [Gammaproteobacteria bacterium]|nr:hypothetical protein [Gammaproteobacteria bacterium]